MIKMTEIVFLKYLPIFKSEIQNYRITKMVITTDWSF